MGGQGEGSGWGRNGGESRHKAAPTSDASRK